MSQAIAESWKSIEKAAAHLELGRQREDYLGNAVFEARQLDVNRWIHVRVCPLSKFGLGATPEQVKENLVKLRGLNHPGLLKIYGGGVADGLVYIETEPMSGLWPDDLASKRPLSQRQKLELVIRLCETLAYLNSHGASCGPLMPRRVLIQRLLGTLRLEPKLILHKWSALKSDGADQPALSEFITSIVGLADDGDSDIDRKLRKLASECASATAIKPTFAEMLQTLRPLLVEQSTAAASPSIHRAESLRAEIPPPQTTPERSAPIEGWKFLGIIGLGTVLTLFVMIVIADNSPYRNANSSNNSRSSGSFESSLPAVQMQPSTIRRRVATPPETISQQRPQDAVVPERTYHFTPSFRTRFDSPSSSDSTTGKFDRPRMWGPELEEDACELSEPAWTESTFGAPVLSVHFSCSADLSHNHLILWIIESNGRPQYEARLIRGIKNNQKTLTGEISTVSANRLEQPLTTYLAEDPIGPGEPRRVSNILAIPVVSEE